MMTLTERYKIACGSHHKFDEEKVRNSIAIWLENIGAPKCRIKVETKSNPSRFRLPTSSKTALCVKKAWNNRPIHLGKRFYEMRDQAVKFNLLFLDMNVWIFLDKKRISNDENSWESTHVGNALDGSEVAQVALHAEAHGDKLALAKWMPLFEAFEAGLFKIRITGNTVFIAPAPNAPQRDTEGRLHCETGPAFSWLGDIKEYYWRGTKIPSWWIERRRSLTPNKALRIANLELRRAACELLGWDKILDKLRNVIIDTDPDPEIGQLILVWGHGMPVQRFLRVQCGTGRRFAMAVPRSVNTALEANAWMYDIPVSDMSAKEFRT